MSQQLIPVLLGADLNCYNVARAFHEAYGVISYAFGRYPIGVTQHTRIVSFQAVPDLDDAAVMIRTVNAFAQEHPDAALILMGCTDDYVAMIIRNKAAISDRYVLPYIEEALMDDITSKANFYTYCEQHGIPYPKTVIAEPGHIPVIPFSYPVILKPSSSVLYWKHPFDGMKKVYTADNEEEAHRILSQIYANGYPDKVIIQDRIPGNDTYMYTLTAYSDRTGKVRMMCLGHVLLEEHTPKGLGNHAAVITEKNDALMDMLKTFLENVGYVGFSNFDIKLDPRDGQMKLFEINVRQGRSNYFVTAAGNNIARWIVEDWIEKRSFEGCLYSEREIYWRYIPDRIVYRYSGKELNARVRALKRAGAAYSSMRYAPDLRRNWKRRVFIAIHEHNHIKKFKTYYKG